MTTIGMHYEVIPGKEEEFEHGFIGVLNHLKTVPGHVESHLYEDVHLLASCYYWQEAAILALPQKRRVRYAERVRQERSLA